MSKYLKEVYKCKFNEKNSTWHVDCPARLIENPTDIRKVQKQILSNIQDIHTANIQMMSKIDEEGNGFVRVTIGAKEDADREKINRLIKNFLMTGKFKEKNVKKFKKVVDKRKRPVRMVKESNKRRSIMEKRIDEAKDYNIFDSDMIQDSDDGVNYWIMKYYENPKKFFKEIRKEIPQLNNTYKKDKDIEKDVEDYVVENSEVGNCNPNYFEAIMQMLVDSGYDFEDVNDIVEGNYGYGQIVEVGREEYWFMTEDEADEAVRENLENLLDDIGIQGINGWKNFVYVSDTDKRIIAREEADFRVEDMSDDEIIEEAGIEDEYDEAGEMEDWDAQSNLIDKAREIVESDIYDEVYDRLENDLEDYLSEMGYSDISEVSFVQVDTDDLIDYIIRSDGRCHCLPTYDGNEYEFGDVVYYRVN